MKHLLFTIFSITTIINLHAADPEEKLIDFIKQEIADDNIDNCVKERLKTNDVNRLFKGQGLLHCAAVHGAVDVMQMLYDKGADLNLRNIIDSTPLHYAASFGHPDAVTFLLTRGAQTNIRDFSNKTPAQLALKEGHDQIAQLITNFQNLPDLKEPDTE